MIATKYRRLQARQRVNQFYTLEPRRISARVDSASTLADQMVQTHADQFAEQVLSDATDSRHSGR